MDKSTLIFPLEIRGQDERPCRTAETETTELQKPKLRTKAGT